MGARGRAHIADNFSATRVLGEIVQLYDRLLAEGQGQGQRDGGPG